MPIKKSAVKTLRQDNRRASENRARKRVMRGILKEINELVAAGKHADAMKKLSEAYKAIDKAAKKKVIKKNTAARKKSRLVALLNREPETPKKKKAPKKKAKK